MVESRVPIPWRTTIDGVDWSQSQVSYTVTRDSFDAGGVVRSGTLVLARGIVPPPASLNTRANPVTFRPGRLINVELWDGATWRQHPLFPMRNSVKPIPPAWDENTITLDLVCELGYYLNLPAPDEEKLVIPAGGQMAYHTAAYNLLIAGEVPANKISLPTTWSTRNLNFSPPKEGGSWVQMAIDLAEVENQILYTNSAGLITSRPVNIAPESATITIAADSQTIDYRPYQEVAAPPHKVTVYGNGRATSATAGATTSNVFTVYGEYSGIITNASGRGVISRLIESESQQSTTLTDGYGGSLPVTIVTNTRELQKPAGLVNERIEPRTQIITAERKTTKRYFNDKGLLFREIVETREPRVAIDPKAEEPLTPLRDSSEITTNHVIANEEYVETIRTVVKHPKAKVYPETDDHYTLVKAQYSEQNWRRKSAERYSYFATELIPLYQAHPESVDEEEEAYRLVGDPNFIPQTENLPPAPQTLDSASSENDEQFSGVALFTDPGGPDIRERTYEETLAGYCVSSEQCQANAQTKGALLWGRNLGSEITISYQAQLLDSDHPLWRIDVIEPAIVDYRSGDVVEQSYRQSYLTDAETWEHTPEGLDIAYLGVWIGTSPSAIAAPTGTPYTQPVLIGSTQFTATKAVFAAAPLEPPGTSFFFRTSTPSGSIYYESLDYEVAGDGTSPATWKFIRGIVAASVSPTAPYAVPIGVDHEWRVINAGNSQITEIWVPNNNATAWIREF